MITQIMAQTFIAIWFTNTLTESSVLTDYLLFRLVGC